MLERCFAVSSKDIIDNTVKRLSSPDAVLLLRAAIQRLQSRPVRGEQLQTWIRAMLVSHTAYFISAPGAWQPGPQQRRFLHFESRVSLGHAEVPNATCMCVQAHKQRWQPCLRRSRPGRPGMSRCSRFQDGSSSYKLSSPGAQSLLTRPRHSNLWYGMRCAYSHGCTEHVVAWQF